MGLCRIWYSLLASAFDIFAYIQASPIVKLSGGMFNLIHVYCDSRGKYQCIRK